MVERLEAEIAKMEADMQSQMSETPSARSRVDELIAQAQAEAEEEKSSVQRSQQDSRLGDDLDEADEDEEESGSDDENSRVFYKASELIVSFYIHTLICNRFNIQHQPRSVERQWLRKHGKAKYIDFTEDQMKILNDCFNDLDEDGSHAIGIDELEDPLIALGLVDTR